jgi:two-component system KDP operon response regulator KdpE
MEKSLALIIEDDQKLGDIFSLSLQAAEFETEIVTDGKVALARLAATRPDLVVLDLHLPHVSGEKILQHIRADVRLANTRVMLVTADALMAEGLLGEADLVLLKPISPAQLRDLASRLRPPDIVMDE